MRFHTTHLMVFVAVAAFVFGLVRHPESLRAAAVPLVGGVFVVLPVLGTLELLTPRTATHPQFGWGGVLLLALVATVGSVTAIFVGLLLLTLGS